MIDRCPFGEMETCELWIEYQVLQNSLEESTELVEAYMDTIKRLQDYVEMLELKLRNPRI